MAGSLRRCTFYQLKQMLERESMKNSVGKVLEKKSEEKTEKGIKKTADLK